MQLVCRALKKGPTRGLPRLLMEAAMRLVLGERKWGLDPKAAAWVKGHF